MNAERLYQFLGVNQKSLHPFLIELCEQARSVAKRYFRQSVVIERKADTSPVTQADREIESVLRERIERRFPEHAILGEEFGSSGKRGSDQPLWVLDPIDGTKNFITGKPIFGTLIGLCLNGLPYIGAIDMPILNERWVALGDGVTWGIRGKSQTSQQTSLNHASLYATSPDMFNQDERARFDILSRDVAFRSFGGDCYSYALLAEGFIDLVVEASLKAHDFCALAPVITGAGGTISDWTGAPVTIASKGQILAAANPPLHLSALRKLNSEN